MYYYTITNNKYVEIISKRKAIIQKKRQIKEAEKDANLLKENQLILLNN